MPGVLKARFGAHEVIVTIMLNFIVLALLNYIVAAQLHVPETLHTPAIHAGALPRLADVIARSTARRPTATLLLALVAAVAVWWFLFRTRARLRAARRRAAAATRPSTAASASAAHRGRGAWRCRARSRALGGVNFVLGYKHYYEDGFAGGAGFLGIAVALVGRNHPVGVVLAALFFATLSQGGLAINALVPKQMVDVLQASSSSPSRSSVPEVRRVLRARRARRQRDDRPRRSSRRRCASRCRTCSRRRAA